MHNFRSRCVELCGSLHLIQSCICANMQNISCDSMLCSTRSENFIVLCKTFSTWNFIYQFTNVYLDTGWFYVRRLKINVIYVIWDNYNSIQGIISITSTSLNVRSSNLDLLNYHQCTFLVLISFIFLTTLILISSLVILC